MQYLERMPRSLAKVISWRILMIIQYFVIGYAITGSVSFGAGLAGVTTVVNSVIYFCHERIWNRSQWGKQIASDAE